MTFVITPAGFAICTALKLACESPFDFAVTIPVSVYDEATSRMQRRDWRSEIQLQYRYDYLSKCAHDKYDRNASCGFFDECVMVAIYVETSGEVGGYRLCRAPRRLSQNRS